MKYRLKNRGESLRKMNDNTLSAIHIKTCLLSKRNLLRSFAIYNFAVWK